MKILNKILNYAIALIAITLFISLFFSTINKKYINTTCNTNSIPFDEENIIKYSKEYYESKYDKKSDMHYIICDGGKESGKFYCIVKIKSFENIKSSPKDYIIKLKVYDDGKVIEI